MSKEWKSRPFVLNDDGVEAITILKSLKPQLMAWYVVSHGKEIPLHEVKPDSLLGQIEIICRLPQGMHWERKNNTSTLEVDDPALLLFMSLIYQDQQRAFAKLDANIVSSVKR